MILFRNVQWLLILTLSVGIVSTDGFYLAAYAQDAAATEDGVKEEKASPDYSYNAAGRRDPFAPLLQEMRKLSTKPEKEKGPLEKFQLSQFRLMALLIIEGTPRAMVKAPDGKSYTVKPGDLIGANGGLVLRIETKKVSIDEASGQRIEKSPDRVVVEETGVDNYTGKIFKEYRYIEM